MEVAPQVSEGTGYALGVCKRRMKGCFLTKVQVFAGAKIILYIC